MKSLSLSPPATATATVLLLLCAASKSNAPNANGGVCFAAAATAAVTATVAEAKVVSDGKRNRNHRPASSTSTSTSTSNYSNRRTFSYSKKKHVVQNQNQLDDDDDRNFNSDRRMVPLPWVSIAILMAILFQFKSFAAPFFDPLGEPRRATTSSVYFSLLVFLYMWLAIVTILTVLPQFSTKYNIVIAAALFFYMVFVSICALLVGRFLIRGVYYLWLVWKMGRRSSGGGGGNDLESRILSSGWIARLSRFVWAKENTRQQQSATTRDKANTDAEFKEAARLGKRLPFPVLIAFQRPFRRLFSRSVFLSAVLCCLYSHCWSRSLSAFNISKEEGARIVCRGVFVPMLLFGSSTTVQKTSSGTTKNDNSSCHENHSCADERSIWILWTAAIIGYLFYYTIHEFTGKHHKSSMTSESHSSGIADLGVSKSSNDLDMDMDLQVNGAGSDEFDEGIEEEEDDDNEVGQNQSHGDGGKDKDPWQTISATIHKFRKTKPEQPKETLAMVSWYSNIIFSTGFDMLVSFKIFLGRFDARKMHAALLKEKRRDANQSTSNSTSSIIDSEGVFDFSNCKHYNHGSSVKKGDFWFDFVSDCGDGFNSSYQISRLLAQPTLNVATPTSLSSSPQQEYEWKTLPRGKLLINGGDLAYPDPTPDNYEKRFFRTFEDAMPPPPSFRKEHISIHKPALPVRGWKMDNTETEGNGQTAEADDLLSSYQGPCTFLIPGNHDWFDGLSTYTRYILSRDWLGGWLMPQRTSYFALKLPKGWWILGFDLALDDDINIEQFQFFANLAQKSMKPDDFVVIVSHVPHWVLNEYENHSKDSEKENNLSELIRTHLRGRVKLRIAGDLHHYTRHVPSCNIQAAAGKTKVKSTGSESPMLIVAGGGGAFLHPTHCFQDKIKVGQEREDYSRVCAYPSTKVSRHLSWLNLWQFRWRNWRLDILWAITHFGICTSLFPLCGIYDDYLQFNPDHNLGYLLLWVFLRVLLLFGQILASGRMSLFFTMIIICIAYTFTDSSNLKWRTHLGWSLAHALAHISSALICILFLECMAEFVVSEGLVVTQNVGGASKIQTCETGLATSIYHEYTEHFSHTLEDFQLLNTTNSTLFRDPPDLFPSCRFDESLYEMVSSMLSWLYHEAPFLKTTLAIFDLPGVIGSTHVAMCDVLCTDGAECTYSNSFLRYQQLDRITILKYLASISLYFVVFAVPVAGNVFGTWLAITLNYFNCQYDEGFSSLRMEHWKNFLRMRIDEKGDLEIFAIGLHRVPKKWRKDPCWEGHTVSSREAPTKPSWMWKTPSKWKEWRNRKKFAPQMIDYTKIKR